MLTNSGINVASQENTSGRLISWWRDFNFGHHAMSITSAGAPLGFKSATARPSRERRRTWIAPLSLAMGAAPNKKQHAISVSCA